MTDKELIQVLIEAVNEGLNQLAIAAPYVRAHGNDKAKALSWGSQHTAWECNEIGKASMIDALVAAEEHAGTITA